MAADTGYYVRTNLTKIIERKDSHFFGIQIALQKCLFKPVLRNELRYPILCWGQIIPILLECYSTTKAVNLLSI